MIIFINKKDFESHDKKLLKIRNYLLIDAIEGDDGLEAWKHVISNGGLEPGRKLIRALTKGPEEVGLSERAVENLYDNHMESMATKIALLALVKAQVAPPIATDIGRGERNVFVVMTKATYKIMAKEYVKYLKDLMGVDFRFACMYKQVKEEPKLLKKEIGENGLRKLNKRVKELEDKLSLLEKEKKKKKKDKDSDSKHGKKDKKKDKKKKKHKKSTSGILGLLDEYERGL